MAKLVIKGVRFSYIRVFEAEQFEGSGDANYSVTLLVPKSNVAAVAAIKTALDAMVAEALVRFPRLKGKVPALFNYPLHDGDEHEKGGEYAGCYYMRAKRKDDKGAPLLLDARKNKLLDVTEWYSGCWGAASLAVYPYDKGGKSGISVQLNGLQKTDEGERLDGGASLDDFDAVDESDDIFS